MRAGESAHRGARWGTKAVVYIIARGFGSVVDDSVRPGSGFQQNYGNGLLQLDYADITSRKRLEDGDSVMVISSSYK